MYTIYLSDRDGHTLASTEADTLKAAKQTARDYLVDPEYTSDAHKVSVYGNGHCVYDAFPNGKVNQFRHA